MHSQKSKYFCVFFKNVILYCSPKILVFKCLGNPRFVLGFCEYGAPLKSFMVPFQDSFSRLGFFTKLQIETPSVLANNFVVCRCLRLHPEQWHIQIPFLTFENNPVPLKTAWKKRELFLCLARMVLHWHDRVINSVGYAQ